MHQTIDVSTRRQRAGHDADKIRGNIIAGTIIIVLFAKLLAPLNGGTRYSHGGAGIGGYLLNDDSLT